MSTRYENLASVIVLSPAELAVRSDGDLAAFMAASSSHGRLSTCARHRMCNIQ